jgi:hypothetical protein
MSDREIDVDGLFDRDADTQLLERRRRQELGLLTEVAPPSAAAIRFGPESILRDEAPRRRRAAMLRVALDARPDRELIPGAVVTIVATVHDDGEVDAADVTLRVAIPAECEAVPDSFARDDAALDGEALLGEGVRVGTIAAGDAVRVRFAVRVLPGTGALHVIAHASAPGVPTIAPPALRLTRRAGHAAFHAPRPFFELEADEAYESPATVAPPPAPAAPRAIDAIVDEPAAPEIAAPHVIAPESAPPESAPPLPPEAPDRAVLEVPEPVAEPLAPEIIARPAPPEPPPPAPAPQRREVIAPAVVIVKRPKRAPTEAPPAEAPPAEPPSVVEPPSILEAPPPDVTPALQAEIAPAPAPEPKPAPTPAPKPRKPRKRAAPRADAAAELAAPYVFARTLDDDAVHALERIFAGDVPHGLAALAVLTSIAGVDTPLAGALGLRAFAQAVAAALPRALVAARLNQTLPAVVTREALDAIRADAAAPSEPFPQYFPLLVTRLDERDLGALRTVLARDLDDAFLRGVQVLLAIAPRALDGVPKAPTARVADALTAYRAAAGAWLMRVTVRRAVDKRHDPLVAKDAALHDAGRALVAALRAAVP